MGLDKAAERPDKYLLFSLGSEGYGISVSKVKEIIRMMPLTTLPQTPDYVQGVVNLRGKVVPVVSLRSLFHIPEMEATAHTCIIVLEATSSDMRKCWIDKHCDKTDCPGYENDDQRCWMLAGTHCRNEIQGTYHQKMEACRKCDFHRNSHEQKHVFSLGIIVDAVLEVANIKSSDIESPRTIGGGLRSDYFLGMAKLAGGVKTLLNIDRILSTASTE